MHTSRWMRRNLDYKEHAKQGWSKRPFYNVHTIRRKNCHRKTPFPLLTTELVDLRVSVFWWFSCDWNITHPLVSCPYIFVGLNSSKSQRQNLNSPYWIPSISCRASTDNTAVRKFQVLPDHSQDSRANTWSFQADKQYRLSSFSKTGRSCLK